MICDLICFDLNDDSKCMVHDIAQLTQCEWFIIVQCKGLANCAYFNYFIFLLEMASVPNYLCIN